MELMSCASFTLRKQQLRARVRPMKKLLLALLLTACGRTVSELESPPPPSAPVEVRVVEPADRIVDVRVGGSGYCTRSLKGTVRCHASYADFTLATQGARALAVQV